MMIWASETLRDQCSFKHSSRYFPVKAFHVCVLDRLTGPNETQLDVLRPTSRHPRRTLARCACTSTLPPRVSRWGLPLFPTTAFSAWMSRAAGHLLALAVQYRREEWLKP
jgi:hypothetical protein